VEKGTQEQQLIVVLNIHYLVIFGCKTYHTESKLPIHSGWEFEQPGLAGGARAYNKGVGN